MPDAWETLVSNSVAPPGSDAWTHLLNQQGGGGGGDTYLTGCIDVEVGLSDATLLLELVDHDLDVADVDYLDVDIEAADTDVSDDGFDIDHGTC